MLKLRLIRDLSLKDYSNGYDLFYEMKMILRDPDIYIKKKMIKKLMN